MSLNSPHKKRKLSHVDDDLKQTNENKEVSVRTSEKNPNDGNNLESKSATVLHEKNKKSTKKQKTKHLDPELLKLRRTIQLSCASDDFHTAIEAYRTMHIEKKVKMEPQSYYNFLNLCAGGIGDRGIHIGTPKPDKASNSVVEGNDKNGSENKIQDEKADELKSLEIQSYTPKERKEIAYQLKQEMDELEIPLNETAYTALIRLLCQPENNDLQDAEELLHRAENTQQCKPKLRMYGCLIDAFCNTVNNNLTGALRVWSRMCKLKRKDKNGSLQNKLELTEKEYCLIMKCAIRIGDSGVFQRILSEIAEDVLVPSLVTKDTIIAWFKSEHAMNYVDHQSSRKSALDYVLDLPKCNAPCMGPINYNPSEMQRKEISSSETTFTWMVTSGDRIDTTTGILQTGCLKGQELQPVQLNGDSWKKMLEMNDNIVVKGEVAVCGKISSTFAGGGKGKKRVLTENAREQRIKQWESFKSFLNERIGPPICNGTTSQGEKIDIVIDGANIGYYKRNFANAPKHVDYKQIDWVVDHFKNENKNVLLFMHERHFNKNLMPTWAERIINKWDEMGILYRTPYGSNDDWFWMHTALWCGRGTMVLSNDLMRDHHFQMLAHRSFLRWKERHQVYFDFGKWNGKKREVNLTYPDKYSRRIQRISDRGLVIPLPRKGDMNRFLDGQHEADDTAPSEETYVSIAMN